MNLADNQDFALTQIINKIIIIPEKYIIVYFKLFIFFLDSNGRFKIEHIIVHVVWELILKKFHKLVNVLLLIHLYLYKIKEKGPTVTLTLQRKMDIE